LGIESTGKGSVVCERDVSGAYLYLQVGNAGHLFFIAGLKENGCLSGWDTAIRGYPFLP
jgi:hypothetical protein